MRTAVSLLMAFLIAACGPRVQDFGPGVQSPELRADEFRTADGARLPVATWRPEGRPKAVIVAVHGFQMYSGHFQDAGPWWASRGVLTYAYDQRGHGGGPERGIWGGVDALTADAAAIVRTVADRHPETPIYLLGSSMGGAVALVTMARYELPVDGVVLLAPAVWGGEALNPLARWSLWLAAHVMPWNNAGASDIRRWPSDNIEMLRANGRDKMIVRQTRFDTLYGLSQLMADGFEAASAANKPILLMYGARDEIIPAGPVFRAADNLSADHRFVLYPDGWHMLLRDLQAETVWRDIYTWVNDRAAPLPSGFEVVDRHAAWASLTK